ncbi:MAG: hypothetical protein IT537_00415 [Hyphomicrobiales bacterium]|nr:hypothetical protein [Hyphomicrobiales bacterium]
MALAVAAIVAVLVLPMFKDYPHAAPARVQVHASPAADCAAWDATAGDALAGLVHAKMDLTQVSDVIARLRRARRTCELGWIALACRDYQTIIAMAPRKLAGPAGARLGSVPPLTESDEPVGYRALGRSIPPRHLLDPI